MADLLRRVDISHLGEGDIPEQFLDVATEGWTTSAGGARVLSALASASSGKFFDVVQEEYSVNGRGMIDYDLPVSGNEREETLLRRCLAYCFACLDKASEQLGSNSVMAYVSISAGGLDEEILTANVTFCGDHPGFPPYVEDIESYREEALIELVPGDYVHLLEASEA
ncbi:hypothetical protein ACFWDI_01885 [Streptomyces sp. NPDC060064]|uniref:hypothetical protein n=1 Tax=Streptomyces sp. NPDC060064 TaxID=3347049 RepID=UPI0036BD7EC2